LKIAISGKGGVGKTTIAGILARILSRKGVNVLAIDADPSANLGLTLAIPKDVLNGIIPISENYALIEKKTGARLDSYSVVFRLSFRVDDIVEKYTIKSPDGVNLLVMGSVKGAGEGCACPANALIRSLLRHLIVKRNEAVIVDMEAGVEHLGRGTAEHVDCMLIITEPTVKSMEVAKKIYDLAGKLKIPKIFLVGNKIITEKDKKILSTLDRAKKIIAFVPFDERIKHADAVGNWQIDIDEPSPGISKIQELLEILIEKSVK